MMKFNPSWFTFFLLTLTGIFFVISSDNAFSMWIGFELTVLGFLPMFTSNFLTMEGLMKYFLIQAGGSTIFLAAYLWPSKLNNLLLMLAMLLKLGVVPCYQWVPSTMASLSWTGCLFLTTLQKIPALSVLSLNPNIQTKTILIILSTISIFIGGLKGFNQTHLRPLMGYSSISQTGWMILAATMNTRLLAIYFLFYSYITYSLFQTFQKLNSNKVAMGNQPPKLWLLSTFLLLNLAGFPPLSMFLMKSVIFASLTSTSLLLIPIATLMIVGTTISIYYYLTFITPSFLTYWREPYSTPLTLFTHTTLSSLAYPIILLI